MAETEEGRLELKRFAARRRVKQEPTDASQDLSRSFDRSYSATAPSTPTPVGEEDMASPVHPATEFIAASERGSDRAEESDDDAMSQYSAQSQAQGQHGSGREGRVLGRTERAVRAQHDTGRL